MKYDNKTHRKREVSISEMALIGHSCMRVKMHYSTKTNKQHTYHTQVVEFSLCDAQYIGRGLQDAADALEQQLIEFRSDISGG